MRREHPRRIHHILRRPSPGVAVFPLAEYHEVRHLCAGYGAHVMRTFPHLRAPSAARCDELAFSGYTMTVVTMHRRVLQSEGRESAPLALASLGIAQVPVEGEQEHRVSRKESPSKKRDHKYVVLEGWLTIGFVRILSGHRSSLPHTRFHYALFLCFGSSLHGCRYLPRSSW